MTATALSLWLPPPPKEAKILQGVINKLADKYNAPKFHPHITLLNKVPEHMTVEEILTCIRSVVPPEDPLPIKLSRVESGDFFFQCVLVSVEKSEYIMTLNRDIRKAFDSHDHRKFFPHLSLVYGDYTKEKKERIVQDMYDEGLADQRMDGVEIAGVESFEITEIWVVDCSKPIEQWEVLAKESIIS
ncbi:LigT-like protein [Dacryopinax primogenitus]|uniref:LigT-like protein n=1 Tax=Dacryopinax primogenitus (strain DJM 731) TaxID=1858805 RepID=M5GGF1_DACPD|nr:LigT-like protein [Dacryopinax primogenitus]EJU05378.1 LigT-like protein [Dacryopinax primogenitus]